MTISSRLGKSEMFEFTFDIKAWIQDRIPVQSEVQWEGGQVTSMEQVAPVGQIEMKH